VEAKQKQAVNERSCSSPFSDSITYSSSSSSDISEIGDSDKSGTHSEYNPIARRIDVIKEWERMLYYVSIVPRPRPRPGTGTGTGPQGPKDTGKIAGDIIRRLSPLYSTPAILMREIRVITSEE
jgi:hypothetical protein